MSQETMQSHRNGNGVMWSKILGSYNQSRPVVRPPVVLTNMERVASKFESPGADFGVVGESLRREEVSGAQRTISSGSFKVDGGALVNLCGDADLLASGFARVYAWGHSRVYASEDAKIFAANKCNVTAGGEACIVASGNCRVYATDKVTVMALDSSEVYASGSVKVKAFGFARVYASGNAVVEVAVPSDCSVFLYGNAKMFAINESWF